MTTAIPLTVFNQIVQTNSFPETIVALLNEAEATHSSSPRHWNSKRVYPFWKTCQVCSKPFPCLTKEQAIRNNFCGRDCLTVSQKGKRKRTPLEERKGLVLTTCPVCGKQRYRFQSEIRKGKTQYCSTRCNGVVRGQEWAKHAYKAKGARTPEGIASCREKMTGANNPAWKGGVTYFKKHGNYAGGKYIRCPAEYLSMARKDGYVMEHRILVAQAIGRCLLRSEVVHHKDHDPKNNSLSNLQLFRTNQEHKLHEHHGTPAPIWSL